MHTKEVCRHCHRVVRQCRCIGPKTIKYVCCNKVECQHAELLGVTDMPDTPAEVPFEDLPLGTLNEVAEFAFAADDDVNIVEHTQDDQPEHGTNTQDEMMVGVYESD